MRKKSQRILLVALALSVLFHLAIPAGLWLIEASKGRSHAAAPIEVEVLSPEQLQALLRNPSERMQVVEQSETALNDETPEDAKYLSRNNQRVKEQTRAAAIDDFRNQTGPHQQGRQAGAPPTPKKAKSNQSPMERLLPKLDIGEVMKERRQKEALAANSLPVGDGVSGSASSDHLKDVSIGAETLLSTREFVFYSYFERIRRQLSEHWTPEVRKKVENLNRQGRSIASEQEKVTKSLIILDAKGNLVTVKIISQSGVIELDEAVVETLRSAAPFPNPPEGIIEKDGTIQIRWDFVLAG